MIIQARFGTAQADIGYQFYDDTGTLLGARVLGVSISEGEEVGHYLAEATPPATAVGVYWNDTVTLDEASEDLREALALVTISPGVGAYKATVTVTDGAAALQNATVRVTLNGVTKGTGTTDASGNLTLSLDAATYTVAITLNGYQFTSTTRTVTAEETGTLIDTDLEMSTLGVISAPSDPDLITVYVDTVDLLGTVITTLKVTLKPTNRTTVGSAGLIAWKHREMAHQTGTPGRYQADVERDTDYTAECEALWDGGLEFSAPAIGDSYDLSTA